MKTILSPEKWVLNLYPENEDTSYEVSKFIIVEEYNDEIILFHTITWAIYILTKKEYNNITDNEYLKSVKVVLNADIDELSIAEEAYRRRMTKKQLPTYDYVITYIVFTTTACNARCDYCYEKGTLNIETMTEKTAEDLIQFIIKHRYPNGEINLQWFGGEPLLNTNVIDYICSRLRELEIPYKSTMISNAYLFNQENINKAKELWNLKDCQITIDGLFEDYNTIKNYVYSDIDAFTTLIDNIKNILKDTDIHIKVRFNISNDNIFKMYNTISFLKDEFSDDAKLGKISFYVNELFDIMHDESLAIDGFKEELERITSIAHLNNNNKCDIFTGNNTYKREKIHQMCMAFDGYALAILPDGTFSPCEHIRHEDIFGNIIEGVQNKTVIEKWQTFDGDALNYCREQICPLHPICPRFYNCPSIIMCNEKNGKKEIRLDKAHKRLVNTYMYYLNEIEKKKVGN